MTQPRGVDRLGVADRTILASDHGPVPMNVAAVIVVAGGDDGSDAVLDTVRVRLASQSGLRRRLVRPPFGLGAPYWVDDESDDPADHVTSGQPSGDGLPAVLDVAAELVCSPLSLDAPPWTVRWLTGWDRSDERRGALVVVLHHVVVDGVAGLSVLAALADDAPAPPPAEPTGTPTRGELLRDVSVRRWAALRGLPRATVGFVAGLRELGLHERPTRAARTSLNRPTGRTRSLGAVDVPLDAALAAARRRGGTLNDLVVTAVVGALVDTLEARGERPGRLVISVPVSGRSATTAGAPGNSTGTLGNSTGVLPVSVPTDLDREARFAHVAAVTARRRGGLRGSSAAPLGAAFAAIARLGLFRTFVEHQRLVHTFVTNLRGPATRMRLAGREVTVVLPTAVNPGNVGVSFDVLSYAGTLWVVVVADPLVVPEHRVVADRLLAELRALL